MKKKHDLFCEYYRPVFGPSFDATAKNILLHFVFKKDATSVSTVARVFWRMLTHTSETTHTVNAASDAIISTSETPSKEKEEP